MSYGPNMRGAISCALLFSVAQTSAAGDTIRVPGDQPTIQAGIDAARPGDVVLLADGVYRGADNKNLDFGGKAITVRGENGRDKCIIDCENDGRGFFLHSGESGAAIDGLTILNGLGGQGGAMFIGTGVRATITRCSILSNQGVSGAVFCGVDSRTSYSDCEFIGNRDGKYAGGAISCDGGRLVLEDCTFAMNFGFGAGGAVYLSNGELVARRCEFNDNTVYKEAQAGAIWVSHSLVSFDNCRFARNQADRGGAILAEFCEMTIRDCEFNGNNFAVPTPDYGGGGAISARDGSTQIERSIFVENKAHSGGAIAASGRIVIRQCSFERNSSAPGDFGGGGAIWFSGSAGRIEDCIFYDNGPSTHGSAIGCSNITIENCFFRRNHDVSEGGGAVSAGNGAVINNCTFTENSAPSGFGGGVWVRRDSHVTISNSILWNNSDRNGNDESSQISLDRGTVAVNYSCVQGLTGNLGGVGNIGEDPMFVDPANGDLRLAPQSPCIDAGDNTVVPADLSDADCDGDVSESTPFDLDGNKRFFDDPKTIDTGNGEPPLIDMGAYEFGAPPGFEDCNGNEVPDRCDIAEGASGDVNENGIPDECEAPLGDLNCDLIVDAFDIEPFILALFEPERYPGRYPRCDIRLGDMNGDGAINPLDIEPFLTVLFGG